VASIEVNFSGVSQSLRISSMAGYIAMWRRMRQINAAAAAKGYLLVCDRCKNLTEPIVAVIAVANTDDAFGSCGDCYRRSPKIFLGHVV